MESHTIASLANCQTPPQVTEGGIRTGILKPGQTMSDYVGLSVINLSDIDLTEHQAMGLSKGLSFCPTPWEPDMSAIISNLDQFFRKMRLKAHFHKLDMEVQNQAKLFGNKPSQSVPKTPSQALPKSGHRAIWKNFRGKSNFMPPNTEDILESFCKQVRFETLKSPLKPIRWSNMTLLERQGIDDLSKNLELTIKKADKGSAVVVMNTKDYIVEAERQLNQTQSYISLATDPTISVCKDIQVVLDLMKTMNIIDNRCHKYLSPADSRPGRFYLLPKIHKKGVPGRPICSSVNHPTEKISAFVDEHIRKFMYGTKSYVRDTQDFITKIKNINKRPEGTLLVTLDVTSLYTNIPNHDGVAAVAKKLLQSPDPDIPSHFLIKLLKLVLTKNYFIFNGNFYLQVGGTAMGTRLAPSYACTFLGDLEDRLIEAYPLKPDTWLRYIDDIYMEWRHGETELLKFVNYLNTSHDTIKFTMEFSKARIDFLDTTVILDPETSTVYTTLYMKPTDTNDYLEFSSSHPDHCKTGGPKGQFLRLRRICTRDEDFEFHCENMKQNYIRRNYPARILMKHITDVRLYTQDDLLKKSSKPPGEFDLILILEYNPANPDIMKIINNHWPQLSASPTLGQTFLKKPRIAHRRCKNLRDHLIRANTTYPKPDPNLGSVWKPKVERCKKAHCKNCPTFKLQQNIVSFVTRGSYRLPSVRGITCLTTNLIYCLTCTKCNKHYIGETKRSFKARIAEHMGDIKNKRLNKPIGKHFTQSGHTPGMLTFCILELIKGNPDLESTTKNRRTRERFWIFRLRTIEPLGLNSMSLSKLGKPTEL